ncbi:MAG TPA: hypothetical protein PKD53_18915 [Chloroflexaceae bacterium]|nr:hypothetical protein [Chloroflexaceae bacterium]
MAVSETFLIAIVGAFAAIISACIGAFGAIAAAQRSHSQLNCGMIGMAASGSGFGGLVIGVVTAALLVQQPGNRTPLPPSQPVIPDSNGAQQQLLGVWEYQQVRPPMPAPAGVHQAIVAHGDIDNSGTCHLRVFYTGEAVQGLGEGTFKLILLTGSREQIESSIQQIQRGAAEHAGGSCPRL